MSLLNLKSDALGYEVVSANGTVAGPRQGHKTVLITKGTACAITLAAPTAGEDDGKKITFIATTAAAHTVTLSTLGFNAGNAGTDVGTFGGAIGDGFEAVAYNGEAYTTHNVNVTLA